MTNLTGKTALITGGSGGLGKAISERLGSLGANVVVHYSKNKDKADAIVKTIEDGGSKAVAIQADTTKVDSIQDLFAAAKEAFGKIDIVVHTAGIELADLPVIDFTEADYDKLFTINAKGTYFTIQQAAKDVADGGRIIYVTSSTTIDPMPGMAIYGGSKTPGNYLVKVLSRELGHRGVTVNVIAPYAVEATGMFSVEQPSYQGLIDINPFHRLATPNDVANVAEFFAGDLSSFVSGHVLVVTGAAQIA